jgi:putative FmdB family regulatory protein
MPIYEYDCQKCGKRTEVIQGYSDPPLKICPHCGGKKLKKAFSAPAIQFKGSGWYVTDYGKGDSGPRKKESDSTAKSESSGTTESSGKTTESSGKTESSDKSEKKADSGGGDTAGKSEGVKKTETRKKGKKGE